MKRWFLIRNPQVRAKAKRGRCITKRCRARVNLSTVGFVCHKCKQARWRAKHPLKAAYCNLRCHAAQRAIGFDLSFAHFSEVALASGYVDGLNGPQGLSVDRLNESERAYRDGQIQVICFGANVAKENRRRARERAGLYVADLQEPDPF